MRNNTFEFEGHLWFKFEPGTISLDTLKNFSFDRSTILSVSDPEIRFIDDQQFVRYGLSVRFDTGLRYKDFPFDDHRINLVLTNPTISPAEFLFDSQYTDFIVSRGLIPFGWNLVSKAVDTGYQEIKFSGLAMSEKNLVMPIASFSLDVERIGVRHVLTILLPIILLYLLMFFSLSVDPNPSVTITLGGMTAMLAYRFVIEQLSPSSGEFMLSDHFFFLFLTSSMFVFLLNKVDLFLNPLDMRLKKVGIISIHIFFILAAITLFMP